jgi:hypothetical protein
MGKVFFNIMIDFLKINILIKVFKNEFKMVAQIWIWRTMLTLKSFELV